MFGIFGQRVFHVGLGLGLVAAVGADVDDLDLRAGDGFLDALGALARVGGVHGADEQHRLAAVRQRLLHQLAGLAPRGDVVRADIQSAGWIWARPRPV